MSASISSVVSSVIAGVDFSGYVNVDELASTIDQSQFGNEDDYYEAIDELYRQVNEIMNGGSDMSNSRFSSYTTFEDDNMISADDSYAEENGVVFVTNNPSEESRRNMMTEMAARHFGETVVQNRVVDIADLHCTQATRDNYFSKLPEIMDIEVEEGNGPITGDELMQQCWPLIYILVAGRQVDWADVWANYANDMLSYSEIFVEFWASDASLREATISWYEADGCEWGLEEDDTISWFTDLVSPIDI